MITYLRKVRLHKKLLQRATVTAKLIIEYCYYVPFCYSVFAVMRVTRNTAQLFNALLFRCHGVAEYLYHNYSFLSILMRFSFSVSLPPSLFLSITLSLSLSLSLAHYPSLYLTVSLFLSLSLFISLYHCPSLSHCPSLYFSLSMLIYSL